MGFSNILGEADMHTIPEIWEKWIYIKRKKTEISHSLSYLADLEFMRTHEIPNVCECTNSHKMQIFWGKPYHSQAVGFEEVRSYYETQVIHRVWVM